MSLTATGLSGKVRGRAPSIPPRLFGAVARWSGQGFGVRRIVGLLEDQGIYSSKSAVHRLLRHQSPYHTAEVRPASGW